MKKLLFAAVLYLTTVQAFAQATPLDAANQTFLNRDFNAAIIKYQTVLENPTTPETTSFALFQIGECYRQLGNWELAEKAYWKTANEFPESDWTDNAYLALATHLMQPGNENITNVVVLYETILSRYPKSESVPYAWLGLAEARVKLKFFKEAEDALVRIINQYPDNPILAETYYQLTQLLIKPENPDRNSDMAIQYGETCIAKFPHFPQIPNLYYILGNTYWEQGNLEKAITRFSMIEKFFPDSFLAPMAMTNIGLCYTDLKQYAKAIEYYHQLLFRFPQPDSVRKNILKLIERLKSRDKDTLSISAWIAHVDKKTRKADYKGDVRIKLGKTTITADNAQFDMNTNSIRITGKVRLKWGNQITITADEMNLNAETRLVIAKKNVVFSRKVGSKIHEEPWSSIEFSLTDGSSLGRVK